LFTLSDSQRTRDQADHRREEDVLQAYLDQMWKLLLDKDLLSTSKANSNSEALTAARVSTLTTLERIHHNPDKKGIIVKFLGECSLLEKQDTVVILEGANLGRANLHEVDLSRANLSRANLSDANLIGANLIGAILSDANLSDANLNDAILSDTLLFNADLSDADLSGATLAGGAHLNDAILSGANLSGADLSGADLRDAYLHNTVLRDAFLSGANLSGAQGVTQKQLDQAAFLERATMPNGQKYEEWLKSKGNEEDG
jgi:uncharacterized protein YjbI with pentapeptide repeats